MNKESDEHSKESSAVSNISVHLYAAGLQRLQANGLILDRINTIDEMHVHLLWKIGANCWQAHGNRYAKYIFKYKVERFVLFEYLSDLFQIFDNFDASDSCYTSQVLRVF